MKNMINPKLREEINLKINEIAENPQFYDNRRSLVIENLRSMGDIHSFWIENPELREAYLIHKRQPKTLKKEAIHGIQSMHNAWYYLTQIGPYGNFIKELNSGIINRTNGLVLPKKHMSGEYRDKIVTLNLPRYTPPAPQKVPDKMNKAITRIKEVYNDVDPLTSSIVAHLEIAAIQPFFDGNKRTARLIQDRILYDSNLPPAVIPAGEARFYLDLIKKTLPAYSEDDLEGQKQFYDYCASKVNNGLDDVLGDLNVK